MAYKAGDRLVGTLGEIADSGHHLDIHCENHKCGHWVALDVAALVARLGRDHALHDLALAASCSRCGGRFPDLMLQRVPDYERLQATSRWYGLLHELRQAGRL